VQGGQTRIILCKARPRSITGVSSLSSDMCVYIWARAKNEKWSVGRLKCTGGSLLGQQVHGVAQEKKGERQAPRQPTATMNEKEQAPMPIIHLPSSFFFSLGNEKHPPYLLVHEPKGDGLVAHQRLVVALGIPCKELSVLTRTSFSGMK
jgi:hypothetical protein